MLYFHIGAPKTGTNAIQRFMQTHQARLAELGVLYAEPGRGRRHKHDSLKVEFGATTGLGGAGFEALRALREAHPDKRVFVSEEAFYRCNLDEVKRLAGGMLGSGPVTILCWLRDYAGHAVSSYGQSVKGGRRTGDFDSFFEDYMAGPSHAEAISRWGEVFGWENLQLRLFSPKTMVDGDAVADCLAALGLNRSQFEGDDTKPPKANVSPGWQSVELTRGVCAEMERRSGVKGIRRITSALREAIRKASEAAAPEGERTEYLTAEQRARCDAATRADIEALNRHLPVPLPMPDLVERPGRSAQPSIDEVPSSMVAAAMAILALELGADLPDAKRARKKERMDAVAGPREERRAARRAAAAAAAEDGGTAEAPATGLRRRHAKPDKPPKADKPARADKAAAKAAKPEKASKAGKAEKAAKADKPGKENKPPKTPEQKAERRARRAAKAAAAGEAEPAGGKPGKPGKAGRADRVAAPKRRSAATAAATGPVRRPGRVAKAAKADRPERAEKKSRAGKPGRAAPLEAAAPTPLLPPPATTGDKAEG